MNSYYTPIVLLFSIIVFNVTMPAQEIFNDDFELGFAKSEWGVYLAGEDTLTVIETNNIFPPLTTGGNYAGSLQDIDGTYSGAALALAGSNVLMDYSIEADVYCYVNHPGGSAYTGVVVYADNAIGTYIKMVADFDSDARIRLYNNHLDFGTGEYTFEHNFFESDIPGGIPAEDGWHKMKVEVVTLSVDSTAFWCYFDGQELLGCPIYDTSDDRMFWGQFGVFSFQQDNDGIPGYYDNIYVNSIVSDVEYNSTIYLPSGFSLSQNYPNPFNPSTKIKYSIPQTSNVVIKIFDILGNEIETLVNEEKSVGTYEIGFDISSISGSVSAKGGYASGVYFYQIQAVPTVRQAGDPSTGSGQSFVETKKMILLR